MKSFCLTSSLGNLLNLKGFCIGPVTTYLVSPWFLRFALAYLMVHGNQMPLQNENDKLDLLRNGFVKKPLNCLLETYSQTKI